MKTLSLGISISQGFVLVSREPKKKKALHAHFLGLADKPIYCLSQSFLKLRSKPLSFSVKNKSSGTQLSAASIESTLPNRNGLRSGQHFILVVDY